MSEEYKNCLASFTFEGERYCFYFPASSLEDAERKMRAIRMTGLVDGWPCYTYRANAFTMPLVAVWCWLTCSIRNLLGLKQ